MTVGAAPLKGPLVLLMDLQSHAMMHLSEEEEQVSFRGNEDHPKQIKRKSCLPDLHIHF